MNTDIRNRPTMKPTNGKTTFDVTASDIKHIASTAMVFQGNGFSGLRCKLKFKKQ